MAEITTVVSKETVAPGPKTSASNHTAWLEQLESAHWQQRLRYQPESGQQRQAGEPSTQQQAAQQPGRQRNAVEASRDAHAASRPRTAPEAAGQHAKHAAGAALPGSLTAEARPAFGPGLPVLQQMPLGAAAREVRTWSHLRRLAAIDWQAQHAHVMAGEQGVRMWLRDARYEKSDGYRLLLEMRARFAQMGFRLAEFTLNGERVMVSDQMHQADQAEKANQLGQSGQSV